MELYHPAKPSYKGGFIAEGMSSVGIEGDAFHANTSRSTAPAQSMNSNQNSQGHYETKKAHSRDAQGLDIPAPYGQTGQRRGKTPKRPRHMDATDGKCPACNMNHALKDCYYAFPQNAPEWFTPREGWQEFVQYRINSDPDLAEQVQSKKRAKSRTLAIKASPHSSTPGVQED